MKKLLSFLCLLLFVGLLVGCDSVQIKQQLQAKYDQNNPNGNEGICLYLGRIKNYPYTTKYMEENEYNERLFGSNEEFKERLAGFSEIGMFTREKVGQDHGEDIYRYNLTELGQQYLTPVGFCFGRIKIIEIDGNSTVTDSLGRDIKGITFRFEVENVPDWVNDNLEKLSLTLGVNIQNILQNGGHYIEMIRTSDGWKSRSGMGYIRYGFYLAAPED